LSGPGNSLDHSFVSLEVLLHVMHFGRWTLELGSLLKSKAGWMRDEHRLEVERLRSRRNRRHRCPRLHSSSRQRPAPTLRPRRAQQPQFRHEYQVRHTIKLGNNRLRRRSGVLPLAKGHKSLEALGVEVVGPFADGFYMGSTGY